MGVNALEGGERVWVNTVDTLKFENNQILFYISGEKTGNDVPAVELKQSN